MKLIFDIIGEMINTLDIFSPDPAFGIYGLNMMTIIALIGAGALVLMYPYILETFKTIVSHIKEILDAWK